MVAVPEVSQLAATTPKSLAPSIPLPSPQIPGSYALTALQLSLLAPEVADLVPAGQPEGHLAVTNQGVNEAAAAPAAEAAAGLTSPEAAAASPGARRPVFQIAVDATGASVGMKMGLVQGSEDGGSASSTLGQLNDDTSGDVSAASKDALSGQCLAATEARSDSARNEDATSRPERPGTAAQSGVQESVSAAAAHREAPADGDKLGRPAVCTGDPQAHVPF